MRQIFKFIIAKNKLVISLVLVLSVVFGCLSTKLSIDASAETLLLEHDPDLKAYRQIAKRYDSPGLLVVAFTPKDDLFSPKNLELIKNLSEELAKNDMVSSVISILNVPLLNSVKGGVTGILDHTPTLSDKDINISKAKLEFAKSPIYSGNLISKDLKTTAIALNLKQDEKFNELLNERNLLSQKESNGTITQAEKVKTAIAKFNANDELFLGGANMIADDMIGFIKSDLLVYGLSVLALLSFSLWLFFRQPRWIILPMFICAVSAVFTTGIFGMFSWEVTVISSNYIALQLIITISTVIHLVVSYREFYAKHPKYSQNQLIYLTLRDKFSPSFWAIFTTVIGFSSLMSADIKPVIMLGIMMSAGISVSLVLAFLLFGAVNANLKKLAPVRTFENSFKFTKYCANLALNSRKIIYAVCVLVVCFGVYGISKIKVENSFIGYFKESTQIRQGMQIIDTKLGGTIPVDVIVKFKEIEPKQEKSDEKDDFESEFENDAKSAKYWFNSYHTRVAEKIHDYLKEQNFVGNVSSLATLIKAIKELNNGVSDDFLLAAMYEKLPLEYKKILLSPYVSVENDELRFSLRIVDSDPKLRRNLFLKELREGLLELTKNDNVSIEVVGMMVLYNNMLQNLLSSQVDTFGLTVAILFVIFCFVFRSIKLATIAIVSNLIPLCTLFGVMGFFGIPLDVMSITIAAISIGIGVDDIIHYIHRFKEELLTKDVFESIKAAHASIGYAMYYTSFTIFLGFSVMITSNFIPTIYFGLLTDLVMVFMLLGALIILPSLIASFVKKREV